MDDASLVRIHRLQRHILVILEHFSGHLSCQSVERLLALCAVALGIQRHADVLLASAVDGQGSQILNGIQRIAAAADYRTHILTADIDEKGVILTHGRE